MQIIFQLLAWICRLLSRLIVFLTVNNKWAVSTCLQHSTWFINSTERNNYLKLLKIISASESLFWSTCFVAAIPFLRKRCKRLNFSVFVQAWNIQLRRDKLSRFSMGNPYCTVPTLIWTCKKALQTTLNRIWQKINLD